MLILRLTDRPDNLVVSGPVQRCTYHLLLLLVSNFLRYQDGKAIETYTKSRSIEELSAYIDASAKEYSKRQPSSHVTTSQTTTPSTSSSSEVFSIKTGEDLEKIKSEGGFIKFFAPWFVRSRFDHRN